MDFNAISCSLDHDVVKLVGRTCRKKAFFGGGGKLLLTEVYHDI